MITPSFSLTATERILPRLALDFTTAVLDPRVTFTRSTTGTRVNSSGVIESVAIDTPRFDYSPTTLAPLGLLIEESRTNLVTYSEEFDNPAWTKSNATITANATTSPDGALTGDKLVENTSTSVHAIFPANYSATSTTLTASIYAKAAERSFVFLEISNFATGSASCRFNLSAGTAGTASSNTGDYTNVSATIANLGNGWYRCTLTATKGTTNSNNYVVISLDNGTGINYTGNGVSGLFIWGAQLEVGAFSTSYIPTVASQVTRTADVATMTGTNFSSWYNQGQGAVYVQSDTSNLTATNNGILAIGNPALGFGSGEMMYALYNASASGQINFNSFDNGVQQASVTPAVTPVINVPIRFVFAYASTNYAASVSASAPTSGGGSVPTPTSMSIGSLVSGWSGASQYLNGHVQKLNYYPQRIINAEVQAFSK